uniref:Uncharacterized protein n=1 Tax=Timema tahoe TaxID=61484 RepID=A0A7R9IKC4_9NEOP|nr:unnamed protein product [Timema tahoe]
MEDTQLIKEEHPHQTLDNTMKKKKKYNMESLEELGMVKTPEDQLVREEGYKTHAFNVLVSNRLSYHRDIPDTRHHL